MLLLAIPVVAPLPIGLLIWDLFGGENSRKQLAGFGRELTPLSIAIPSEYTAAAYATTSEPGPFPVDAAVPPAFDFTLAAVYHTDLATDEIQPPSEGPDQAFDAQPVAVSSSSGATAQSTKNISVSTTSSGGGVPQVLGSETSLSVPVRPSEVVQVPEGSSTGVLFMLGIAALLGLGIYQRKRTKPPLSQF